MSDKIKLNDGEEVTLTCKCDGAAWKPENRCIASSFLPVGYDDFCKKCNLFKWVVK